MSAAGRDVVLASACDERYAAPAALALLSAASAAIVAPPCLLLTVGVAAATADALRRAFARAGVELSLRPADRLVPPLAAIPPGLAPAGYARLGLPREALALAPRTLYLDADTLTTGRVDETLAVDLGGAPLAAAVDTAIPSVAHRNGVAAWEELGIPPDAPVFNSGVLLIDNARWLAEGIGERTLAWLRERPGESTTFDQGPLNAVAAGRWARLPPWANVQVRNAFELPLGRYGVSKSGALAPLPRGTLHFTGSVKPWHASYPPNRARRAYLAAWADLLRELPRPEPLDPARWAVRRLSGRMPERDAVSSGPARAGRSSRA